MNEEIGKKIWIIADGYISEKSTGSFPSHESICVLNLSEVQAEISISIYFEDKEPMGKFKATCCAKKTNHIRLDNIKDEDGNKVPVGTPYAIKVESNIPVVVQHTRLDTTQEAMALMTTMAYPLA